jgi:hypothetical protein
LNGNRGDCAAVIDGEIRTVQTSQRRHSLRMRISSTECK